jgi:hypothetical protein
LTRHFRDHAIDTLAGLRPFSAPGFFMKYSENNAECQKNYALRLERRSMKQQDPAAPRRQAFSPVVPNGDGEAFPWAAQR